MPDDLRETSWNVLSFPPSNDCDLTCWLLHHYGIADREYMHTIPFLFIDSLLVGGKGKFPAVYSGKTALNGVDAVIEHFEPLVDDDRKLYPADKDQKAQVQTLWKDFHEGIGYAAARWAYFYLLPVRKIMVEPFSRGCPWYERLFVRVGYGLLAAILRKGLKITSEAPVTDLKVIEDTFARVDALLADGRKYLVGDRPTIADFGFSAMAVPAVWPPEYQGAVPPLTDCPQPLREKVSQFRQRAAGEFALRIYRDHGRPAAS